MCVISEGGMTMRLYAGLEFDQVVRQYADTVLRVCVMRLNNSADAEDCFQNTFLKLLTDPPEFRDSDHLKAWLIRVAINVCKNYIRDNRRVVPMEGLPPAILPDSDDSRDISWALMRLEPKYREVLYLFYIEQYKVDEIASMLGRNPNTVKTMLRRGREKLRAVYGGDGI